MPPITTEHLSATSLQMVAECKSNGAASGGRPLLVALSGGPDSVALLLAMTASGTNIEAAHCNFHLRGEESMRDENFVKDLCESYGIKLHLLDVDVEKEALPGESTEMTCRRTRYAWFRKLRELHGFYRIVTGHNADDNVETLFLNLLRGAGLSGLKSMVADTGEIVRPLLKFSRRLIMQFLNETGASYITESTNLSSDYRRNFLRLEVLPLIESRWEGMRTAVNHSIELLQSEERLLQAVVSQSLSPGQKILSWDTINAFPEPQILVFRYLQQYGGSSFVASEITRSLPRPMSGKQWKLGDGCRAVTTRKGIEVVFDNPETEAAATGNSTNNEMRFEWREHDMAEIDLQNIFANSDNDTAWLPFPPGRYELRSVPPQSRIQPIGMRGSQVVTSVIREAGLSLDERKRMKILIDRTSGKVIWIPGLKRARHHLVEGTESKIYSVTLIR